MRRIIVAILGAFVGTTILIGFKSPIFFAAPAAVADAQTDPNAPAGSDPSQPGAPGQTPMPGQTAGPKLTPKPGQTTPAGATSPGATTTSSGPRQSTSTKPPTTTTTTAPSGGTYTGAYVAVKTAQSPTTKSSQCGDCHNYSIAVTITVSGGKITAASVSYNTDPGASSSYYSRAVSNLKPKTLGATTYLLGKVSGATYSGNAYELSLRDAMSKAGL
jgi:uncharacterized protein with FMN-binding domain